MLRERAHLRRGRLYRLAEGGGSVEAGIWHSDEHTLTVGADGFAPVNLSSNLASFLRTAYPSRFWCPLPRSRRAALSGAYRASGIAFQRQRKCVESSRSIVHILRVALVRRTCTSCRASCNASWLPPSKRQRLSHRSVQ